MDIPKLKPTPRREFKERTFEEISKIAYEWLFKGTPTRTLDSELLRFDPSVTKGRQSHGVILELGITAKQGFQGIFIDVSPKDAIKHLENDPQEFLEIINYIKKNSASFDKRVEESLLKNLTTTTKTKSANNKSEILNSLNNLNNTDNRNSSSISRREQRLLRKLLFLCKKTESCSICHKALPTDLLIAAHIKPRHLCSISERTDPNIVMAACKLGCDDFFEKGYLKINSSGLVELNPLKSTTPELLNELKKLEGNSCLAFCKDTEAYFTQRP